MTVSYTIGDSVYINITNKCPNNCTFCIRHTGGMDDYSLWLDEDPSADEIIAAVGDPRRYEEVVFCGFGEPLCNIDTVVRVARELKAKYPDIPLRVNTNGLANLIHGKDIVPDLAGLIDTISISLNAENAQKYVELCRPAHGEQAYYAMLDFAERCVGTIPKVVMSVVDGQGIDLDACRRIAVSLGAEFRVRQHM